jgi:hypothetical protein
MKIYLTIYSQHIVAALFKVMIFLVSPFLQRKYAWNKIHKQMVSTHLQV